MTHISGVYFAFSARNIKYIFGGIGASEKFKTCRDPSLVIEIYPVHLVTQSL
jgi:hypothetical protein